MKTYPCGAIPSPPDARDYRIAAAAILPDKYTQDMPPVVNQGIIGNCVAQACCYATRAATGVEFTPNWVYGRRADTDHQGYGWYIRIALKTLLSEGNVPASVSKQIPLEVTEVQDYVRRNATKLLPYAKPYRIDSYALVTTSDEIKAALVAGMQIVFSAPIETFDIDADGVFRCRTPIHGYHAMTVWGYDGDRFRVQNSWGESWGDGGRCWMIADDILRMQDCWAVTDTISKDVIVPETEDKEVRYMATIKTLRPGYAVKVRETSKTNSAQVGKIKDGSTVLVLVEHGTRREVCYSNGKTYLHGWVPASYIDKAAGYNNDDEGVD